MRNGLRGIGFHQLSAGANRKNSGKFISTLVARLTRNPILKVLSLIRAHRVHALLMGGQACVFYGAAEFSRDTDLCYSINLMSLPDLVQAKKTQRDKNWPMLRRLVEVNYFENRAKGAT